MTQIFDYECPNSTPLQSVEVDFTVPRSGWIWCRVKPFHELYAIACTYVWDPFRDMIAWLEDIAAGCATATWCVNHEGHCSRLQFYGANGSIDDKSDYLLHINTDQSIDRVRGCQVDRRQLVASFYCAFRAMVEDPAYVPREWEGHPFYKLIEELDEEEYELAMRDHPYGGRALRTLRSSAIENWLNEYPDGQLSLFSDIPRHRDFQSSCI